MFFQPQPQPKMTSVSFTSGELLDIIFSLDNSILLAEQNEDPHLAAYYGNIQDQFRTVLDKVMEKVPENRVAELVLAH